MIHSSDEGMSSAGAEEARPAEQEARLGQRRRRPALVPQARTAGLLPSFAQERLWFLHRLGMVGSAYNMPGAFRLAGCLNVIALEQSVSDLILRHESLRTRFQTVAGGPFQVIDPIVPFSLELVNLSGLGEHEREERAQRLASEEAQKPFDLERGPLFRVSLLKLADQEHVLLITLHHIVSDGWSIGVLTQELGELYKAHSQGRIPEMPVLPVQPVDHAIWQREWLQGAELEEQLKYWREQLKGLATLEVPTDHPRPAVSSFKGALVKFDIPAELSIRLRTIGRAHGATLYMVFLAAFQVLLARYGGQDDIVVGSPIAGRTRHEIEGLIGFFVNTLVLRTDLSGNPNFLEVLRRVKATALGAYAHQDLPFEKLVEDLRPARDLSQQPLFQVLFGLNNFPREPLELAGLTWSMLESEHKTAIFDLSLHLFDEPQGNISGFYEYATDLFDRATIERMVTHLLRLLASIVAEPECSIRRLQLLNDDELEQVVRGWNVTRAEPSSELNVHNMFVKQAARTPDAPAVVFGRSTLTYADLNKKANQLARYLRSRGVGANRVVGICLERSLDMLIGVLGTLKAGGAYLPLDPSYPSERLRYMLDDAAPQFVLMHKATRSCLPREQDGLIALDENAQEFASLDDTDLSPELAAGAEGLVFVIYTSGSTGLPKGVAMPHRSMVNLMEWHVRKFGSAVGVRVLQFSALSFDVSFHEIFSTLSTGGTLVLLDEWVRRDARALTEFIRAQHVERLFIPPLMLQSIAEYCVNTGDRAEALQDVIAAGEQLRITADIRSLFKRLTNCRLHNNYGPTETHVVTALTLSGDPDLWPVLPSIGGPIDNAQVYLLDEENRPLPIGVRGEIYIGGAAVAHGYLRRPELTAQRFVTDPFSSDPLARLYKTGDIGRWRTDGTIEFCGRNDEQMKVRGYRIEPGEIEAQLASQPQVKDVAVVARDIPGGSKLLVAYVTTRDGSKPGPEDLRAHLLEVLPDYMVPSAFVHVDCLPLTPIGKLDKRALPMPVHGSYVSRGQNDAPEGPIEEALARIWEDLLGVERVGRYDNYFELGGHSLLSTKLFVRVSEVLGVDLSVIAMFRKPTIEQLAREVESLRLGASTSLSASIEIEEGTL